MGAKAPRVDPLVFGEQGHSSAKTVAVKVPSGTTDYGTIPGNYTTDTSENWANGFRGKGWNGHGFDGGEDNTKITLSIGYK
jgi:hypothetical protein